MSEVESTIDLLREKFNLLSITLLADSKLVLHRLSNPLKVWKTYVANRVSQETRPIANCFMKTG